MRVMVISEHCNQTMSAGIITKKGADKQTMYFNYCCETVVYYCYNKSLRAKVVTEFIYQFLNEHKFTTLEAYEGYI